MILFKLLWKLIKLIFWLLLLGILAGLVTGWLNSGLSFRGYYEYLNNKSWSQTIKNLDFDNPKSFLNIFWDYGSGSNEVLLKGSGTVIEDEFDNITGVEEFEIEDIEVNSDTGSLETGVIEDDFEEFFDDIEVEEVDATGEVEEVEEFGFKKIE